VHLHLVLTRCQAPLLLLLPACSCPNSYKARPNPQLFLFPFTPTQKTITTMSNPHPHKIPTTTMSDLSILWRKHRHIAPPGIPGVTASACTSVSLASIPAWLCAVKHRADMSIRVDTSIEQSFEYCRLDSADAQIHGTTTTISGPGVQPASGLIQSHPSAYLRVTQGSNDTGFVDVPVPHMLSGMDVTLFTRGTRDRENNTDTSASHKMDAAASDRMDTSASDNLTRRHLTRLPTSCDLLPLPLPQPTWSCIFQLSTTPIHGRGIGSVNISVPEPRHPAQASSRSLRSLWILPTRGCRATTRGSRRLALYHQSSAWPAGRSRRLESVLSMSDEALGAPLRSDLSLLTTSVVVAPGCLAAYTGPCLDSEPCLFRPQQLSARRFRRRLK
jgi:hypothetical protein